MIAFGLMLMLLSIVLILFCFWFSERYPMTPLSVFLIVMLSSVMFWSGVFMLLYGLFVSDFALSSLFDRGNL